MSTVRVQVLAALLISLLVSTPGGSARAQTQMNNVIRLRSGVEYIGHALLDTTTNTVHVRFRTGGAVTFPLDSVVSVSTYEEVREAPLRGVWHYVPLEEEVVPCGRTRSWYFGEIRAVALHGEKLGFGAEGVLGVRLHGFSLGVGVGAWSLEGKSRTPVFFHAKYTFSDGCANPFAFLDAGYPFDAYTSSYGIRPSVAYATKAGPKMFGVGVGVDFVISKHIDASIDAGYRYFTLAKERSYCPCAGIPVTESGMEELHTLFARAGLSF